MTRARPETSRVIIGARLAPIYKAAVTAADANASTERFSELALKSAATPLHKRQQVVQT